MHENITYNPLQEESSKYINEDCNIVCLAPTSSGKTIVAEQFLFTAISQSKKGIYLSPLKALTEEKKRNWETKYPLTIVTSDYLRPTTFNTPLILMTTEALDSKTRGRPSWLSSVGCLVVDEAHLIASENRGDSLEIGLMRFSAINREARIILLSATIPNAHELASWLTRLNGKPTKVIETEWRPVAQEHNLIISGNKPWDVIDDTLKMVSKCDQIHPDKQMLIFVHTVGRGMLLAEKIGCPFHYSKLSKERRRMIEQAFIDKKIRRLVCTSTLAYGVNLPADIAVISGATRGPTTVDPIDIKQEAGRAGRYGLSEKGYIYYIFEDYLAHDIFNLCMHTPNVHSVLNNHLYFHIVSFLFRENMQLPEMQSFLSRSFSRNIDLESHIAKLKEYNVIVGDETLRVTKFGKAAALMYLDPIDLVVLHSNLREQPRDINELARAFATIPSRAFPGYIPEDIEREKIECPYSQQTIVATCLAHWMRGDDLFGSFATLTKSIINDIDRWTSALAIVGLNKDYIKAISVMLHEGIPEYLIDLVELKKIGRKRAIKLYEAGITTIQELLDNQEGGEKILGKNLYNEIKMDNSSSGKVTLTF